MSGLNAANCSDAMMSAVCHGLFTRFPTLRVLPIENGSHWVAPLLELLGESYATHSYLFEEDPVAAFKRNVWAHPFHEEDPRELVKLLGADHVIFGSDFPHVEGLADPLSYVDELQGLPEDDIRKIMGGNVMNLLGIAA